MAGLSDDADPARGSRDGPNVSAQVAAYNRFNDVPPPGYLYARMTMAAIYKGTGSGRPGGIIVNIIDQWSNAAAFVSGGSGGPNSLWEPEFAMGKGCDSPGWHG
jgi:hypothetical protein